jgi:uncharacterized protein
MMRFLSAAVLLTSAALAQPAPVSQFLVRLDPVRADFTVQNMTESERAVGLEHAAYLKSLLDQGKLVLAGQAFDPKGLWGIVIVNAADIESATAIGNSDPAVKAKMFRATVVPFRIVFQKAADAPKAGG